MIVKNFKNILLTILILSLLIITACSVTENPPIKTPKDITNIQYGPFEENTLDIYYPTTVTSLMPAVIYIHGGGFVSGDKDFINTNFKEEKEEFLEQNIIVISINYRFLKTASLTEILDEDMVTAVQFIKFNAEKYFIDKEKIGIWGSSAGGGSALYLGTHDDFQDLNSNDGIKRESTSVKVIGHINSQATYELSKWTEILEINKVEEFNNWIQRNIDENSFGVDILLNLDRNDPPVYIETLGNNIDLNEQGKSELTKNIINHHPKHGIYLYNQLVKLGVNSKLVLKENKNEAGLVDFFIKYLK